MARCFIDLDPETTEDAPTKLVEDAGTPQQRRPRRSDITPMNPLRKAEVQLESFAFQPPAKRSKCENAGGSTASQAKNGPSEAPPASLRQHLERRQIQIEEQECKWKRAKAVPANRQVLEKQSLAFLLVSLEERLLLPVPGFEKGFQPGADNFGSASNPECRGSRPVLDLHGVNRDGASVLLHVHGFRPYFYAAKPPGEVNLEACLSTLDRAIRSDDGGVELLEEVERTPLMYYQANSEKFLRVVMSSTKLVNACRKELEKGILLPGGITWQSQAFEVVNIKERFLVDIAAAGGGWIEAQHGRFRFRPSSGCPMTSRAQLEADAHYSCLLGHSAEGEWLQLAPLRMLSLHLRTVGPEGRVCAGACVLRTHGKDDEHSVAWAVGGRQSAEAGAMQLVDSEAVLLEKLKDFILEVDPDIILGYDLLNSHLNSAISRAAALKIGAKRGAKGTLSLGRLNDVASRVKNATFETRQIGKHETKNINVDGRLLFDVLTVTEREHKLSSYTLSALALHFLGESRLELGASDLERLNAEEPRVLAQMARRDAGFAMRLFNNQHCLFRYVEMARVTGVPMEYLLQKGQSVKVVSMILRKARAFGYVLPPQTRSGNSLEEGSNTYEGGAVLEPDTGFYDEPVVALDFASLYPSIMQKHNLCYSTLLRSTSPAPQGDGDATVEEVPMLGHRFVTSKIRRGLVPMVLEELLSARAKAKKELKQAAASGGDPQLRAVLDGRQLALKISANSVYGFTGMSQGALPCQDIAASVTAYGRKMIESAKGLVESKLCKAMGKAFDARVIYGDTDSVMLTLGGASMTEAFVVGKEAAQLVSAAFGAPVKMEFEKVYFPFLLMNKKRYAGLAFGAVEDKGKLDFKGIEVVRRDWCLLVRHMVEHSLHLLLRERSKERAVAYVRESVTALRSGKVDFRLLVISKALVRDGAEAYSARQAHVELAERIRQRDPSKAPKVGERVPYVFVAKGAGANACDRAEDPLHALEASLPLDADYYLDHQLKQPLLRVFEPVLGGQKSSVEQELFGFGSSSSSGQKVIAKAAGGGGGGLGRFVKTRKKCLTPGCTSFEQESGKAFCANCSASPHSIREAYLSVTELLRPLEAETSALLSQCLQCEGGCGKLHVSCRNTDCPIFFRRQQAWRELHDAKESLCKILQW